MQVRRRNVLTDLERLAETLTNHKMVFPHLTLIEELDFIYMWAKTDGNKSCLPEIYRLFLFIRKQVLVCLIGL